jgi:hypothetical protein
VSVVGAGWRKNGRSMLTIKATNRKIEQWRNEHPDYWKQYRQANPDYADRNRNLQQTRNQRSRNPVIANVYELPEFSPLPSGRYRLIPVIADVIANEYELIVEIIVIS